MLQNSVAQQYFTLHQAGAEKDRMRERQSLKGETRNEISQDLGKNIHQIIQTLAQVLRQTG